MKRKNPPSSEEADQRFPPKVGQKRCEVLRARFVWPE